MKLPRFQRTIASAVRIEGYGYWSGEDILVEFSPAPPNSGIVFTRTDLPNVSPIPANVDYLIEVPRRTSLARGGARVEMIEHIMSALAGMWVDNCEVRVSGVEMPALDGSALPFVEAFDAVGYEEQDRRVAPIEIRDVFELVAPARKRKIAVSPSELDALELSFEVDYGTTCAIGRQKVQFVLTPEVFRREIAPCRTFLTDREAGKILAAGLAQRATYQDLLVFDSNGPIDNSLRFQDECARHKVLDLVGDLALAGRPMAAKIVGSCSGHDLNVRVVQKILALESM
ncbi:MAG: UDP-3-O-acyl-N-acetylglucosamine deacetylase [Planctomycetia bacterium]|nr:UDP-3-O-acyl-N-acetylglucosamine deacetylase [Planctomycetia bacterium]